MWLANRMELRVFPEFTYGLKIFGLVGLNFFISLIAEMLLVSIAVVDVGRARAVAPINEVY